MSHGFEIGWSVAWQSSPELREVCSSGEAAQVYTPTYTPAMGVSLRNGRLSDI